MYQTRRAIGGGKYGGGSLGGNKVAMELMLSRQRAKENKDAKLQRKDLLKKNWEKNNEDLRVLEEKHALVKARLEFVRRILKEYYLKLLSQGTDIR